MHSSWGFPFEHFVADLDLEPWMTGWQTALAEGCHSDQMCGVIFTPCPGNKN